MSVSLYDWSMDTDEEGHRDYTLIWQVQTSGATYGPDHALFASGMPLPGSSLSVGNTVDPWAFYQRKGSARLKNRGSRKDVWLATTIFSTRPVRRCQNNTIADPLLEPHRVRGSADMFTREATEDKDGNPLLYSSNERIKGPAIQEEDGYPTIELEQNVAWLNIPFLTDYRYAVNSAAWWGMPARTIRCKTFTWERVLYGTCYFYFRVTTTFQLNENTWDLEILDEGDMVKIAGTSPAEFRRAKDEFEETVHVLLDGNGNALAPGATPVYLNKRVRKEKDFSAVGWPVVIV
jgi:hypothetical protein